MRILLLLLLSLSLIFTLTSSLYGGEVKLVYKDQGTRVYEYTDGYVIYISKKKIPSTFTWEDFLKNLKEQLSLILGEDWEEYYE